MKPVTSLIVLCATILSLVAFQLPSPAITAQGQDSFKDVPSGHWAYRAITDFQKSNILTGYPDGFFSGKRVLTRYEFALATKRAIENVMPPSLSIAVKTLKPEAPTNAFQISPDQVQSFKRLIEEFSKDLAGLQVNVTLVKLRLDVMSSQINTTKGPPGPIVTPGYTVTQGFLSDLPRSVFTDSGALLNSFNFTSRIGSTTASLFANNFSGSRNVFTGDVLNRTTATSVGAPLAIAPPIPDSTVTPLTQSGTIVNRAAGLRVTAPLFSSGTIGGTVIDFSNPASVTQSASDVFVGGINFNLNPIGRVNVSGEASRSVAQFDPGSDPDNNAFNLNVRYGSGPIDVLGGFQYVDPGYDAPGAWNRIGVLSNLTNVQGPFLQVNYALNPRTQFQVGSDLLSGARNRSYNFGGGLTTGFGTHDYISTLSAGMQYKLWRSTSLTADWEGVYWDLSAASSGLGVESHPFESYINLGTGINLRGNAMLKMGYQIGSFGNFSGLGGLGPSGSGQTYNAFTTQLNVKF